MATTNSDRTHPEDACHWPPPPEMMARHIKSPSLVMVVHTSTKGGKLGCWKPWVPILQSSFNAMFFHAHDMDFSRPPPRSVLASQPVNKVLKGRSTYLKSEWLPVTLVFSAHHSSRSTASSASASTSSSSMSRTLVLAVRRVEGSPGESGV